VTSPSRANPFIRFARPTAAQSAAGIEQVIAQGQSLEREGKRQQARTLYEAALHTGSARHAGDAAQLIRGVARTHIQDSDFDAARDCALAALSVSELSADVAGCGHAENLLAIVEWKLSNLDEAERLYRRARASAQQAGEARLATMTASNLGVIATVRGDDGEARRQFESALADARRAGLADQAIGILINLGLLHMQLGRLDAAESSLAEANELATVLGDTGMLITIELDVAKLRIYQKCPADARDCCTRARAIAERTGHTHAAGEAAHVDGLVAYALGELAEAEAHFLRAEEIAIQRSDMILQGETARELAALYREQGRNRQTLQRLNQAHRLFAQLGATVGRRLPPTALRGLIVVVGLVAAIRLLVT